MKTDIALLLEREHVRRQQYEDLLMNDMELFRREATRLYGLYTPTERALLARLESRTVSAYTVLITWEEMLQPLLRELRVKRSEPTFRKAMMKHLFLSADETQPTIHKVVSLRESDVVQKFIINLYGVAKKRDVHRKQRVRIKELFLLFQQEVLDMKQHYINYMLCQDIAAKHHIYVIDPHASAWRRFVVSRRIRSQQKKMIRAENERLAYIDKRTKEIRSVYDGLIATILESDIDLVVVIGMRNQYEKRLAKLSKDDILSPVSRLAVFDEETKAFRESYVSKHIDPAISLEASRKSARSIDDMLLRIFDLTTTQKNQLLVYTKEYRELMDERVAILQARKNRRG